MNEAMEIGTRRIRELLESHRTRPDATITETVAGLVTVTLDAQLQLVSVRLHDQAFDGKCRTDVERAIVDAVNSARVQALKAATESLSSLRDSADWRAAMDEVFRPKSRRR